MLEQNISGKDILLNIMSNIKGEMANNMTGNYNY